MTPKFAHPRGHDKHADHAVVVEDGPCQRAREGDGVCMARDIWVSTDIEADGRAPGISSMLSLASVAYDDDGRELSVFSANLEQLPDGVPDDETMAWWRGFPDAWAAHRVDVQSPVDAMVAYAAWLDALPGRPVFVAWPLAFDFAFVHWYLIRFVGRSPFGHAGLDMKTLALALHDGTWARATKRHLPRAWFPEQPHTHVALDDAREQGLLFIAMLREVRQRARAHAG